MKHFSDRVRKHESSRSHRDNAVKLGLLGRVNVAELLFVEQHNLKEGPSFYFERDSTSAELSVLLLVNSWVQRGLDLSGCVPK